MANGGVSLGRRTLDVQAYAAQYVERLRAALETVDLEAVTRVVGALAAAREEGRNVFVCGNGAAAALASHFASDLNKTASPGKLKFKAIALTENVPLLTAWANDSGYREVFSRQLANLLAERDVVIAISCSGNSENVVAALELAAARGAETIGFFGFDGGKAKRLVDHCIWSSDGHYGVVEDVHAILCHVIVNYLSHSDHSGIST